MFDGLNIDSALDSNVSLKVLQIIFFFSLVKVIILKVELL